MRRSCSEPSGQSKHLNAIQSSSSCDLNSTILNALLWRIGAVLRKSARSVTSLSFRRWVRFGSNLQDTYAKHRGSYAVSRRDHHIPDCLRLAANFALCQAMNDQPSELFLCGRYHDRVVDEGGSLRFSERICVCDSTVVLTSLVYPV